MNKRLEIVRDNSPITAEDAAAYQDFGKVLKAHKVALRWQRWTWAGAGTGVVAVAITLGVWLQPQAEPVQVQLSVPAEEVLPHEESLPEKPKVVAAEPVVRVTPPVPVVAAPIMDAEPEPMPEEVEETESPEPNVFVQAEPVAGFPVLYAYLAKETVYPLQAMPDSVEGIVLVSFTIDTAGMPQRVRVQESLHPLLDAEAMRVIRSMPPWQPAHYGETLVESRLAIPITFQLFWQPPKERPCP